MLAPLVLAAVTAIPAGRARVITAAEVAPILGSVSVLDARDEKAFRAGHVPGSRRVDWKEWTLEKPGLRNALVGDPARWGKVPPADAALEERLRVLGLANARTVVVVGSPSGWAEEGRVAWNLLYWGADDVALLDGGYPEWARDARRPVETGEGRPAPPGSFVLRVRPGRRIELGPLRAALAARSRPLLDARTPEEYAGEKMAGQKRGGHIPGARLVSYHALYRKDGRYVGADEMKRLAGPEAGNSPVTYCLGGVRSALLAVLLEARLGVVAANYDGSVWEWAAHEDLPLETER